MAGPRAKSSRTPSKTSENRSDGTTQPGASKPIKFDPQTLAAMQEFTEELRSFNARHHPGVRNLFFNIVDGMWRGLGFILGTTALLALLLTILGEMVSIPVVGKYVADFVVIVNQHLPKK